MNQCVEGKQGDQKSFKLTLPTNVKKMVIETSEDGGCYLNSADLFVGKSRPSIISTYPYKWNAEYSSILPNRDKENITITNPPSGEWYVMLYGFNNYFSSNLKITLSY